MRRVFAALALCGAPGLVQAQQPAPADTLHHQRDTLARPPVQLQEVTVTATPARPQDPTFTTELTPQLIQRTPATDAWDLLRQAGGVEVHQQGQGPGFASDASLRGFSSDHSTDIALWIDGVPINEPVNGHAEGYNDWTLIFPQAVRRIDVTRGPVSPLFGNFALAGAVSVRTLERMQGTTGWIQGGAYGRVEGGVLTGIDREATGLVVGVRGVRDGGWRPHSGWELGQLHTRYVRDLAPGARLDAGVELYAAGWDSPGFLTTDQFAARDYDVVVDPTDGGFKRRAQERVSLRLRVGNKLIWRSTAYATQGRWQLFLNIPPEPGAGEGTGGQTEEEDHRYGFGATTAATWSLPKVDVTLGSEGRFDHASFENWLTVSRARTEPQFIVAARQVSGALFVQSNADLGHHFRVTAGSRLDALDTRSTPAGDTTTSAGKTVLSPKVGALYHLPRIGALYVNVSRGFRQADGVITDPSIPAITSWAYETGVKLDLGAVTGNVAVFRTDVSNEQTFDPLTLATTNGGRSRRQGVEIQGDARVTPAVRLSLDWTFTDAKYRDFVTGDGEDLSGAPVFNTAKYVGIAAAELAPPGAPWTVRVSSNAVGSYTPFDEPGVSLPPYALFHIAGTMQVGTAVLELGLRNLFDKAYPELQAGGFVSPGQPRSVYGGVRYVF